MIRSYVLFAVALFFLLTDMHSQTGTIKGKVVNAKSNEPIEFANILIQGTMIGSTSDLDGNFTFTGLQPGFIRLVASTIGFETTISSEIQVQGNQTVFIDIALPEAAFAIQEVVVRQNLNVKRIESPISVLTVGVQEIEKSAGANRDVSKVIQALPGVGATDPNRNDLIVRGGGPAENVFYLDGVEIPIINHFATQGASGGAVGILNPDFIREITFYTGAFPASRPNALSSVMEIRQKDGRKDRVHTKLSVGASDAALTVDGPLSKNSTFIVSARQSYLQFLFKAIGLPFLPTYNDFQFKYNYEIDRKNEISFIGIGAIDNLTLNTELQEPGKGTEAQKYLLSYLPVYKQWNYTVGLVYKHFGESHIDNWVLSRNMLRNSNFKFENNDETLPKTSDYISDEAENKFRFERDYPYLPIKLKVGAGLRYSRYTNQTFRRIFGLPAPLTYDTELKLFGYQAFLQASDEFMDSRLKLALGVNAVANSYNASMKNPLNQLSPRVSASFAINEKFDINANMGRYAMQPAYTSMGFKNSSGAFVNRDNLKYLISNQAIAGFEYRPADKIRISIEGFYKQYENYPMSVAEGVSIASKGGDFGQIGDEELTSTGKGRAYGFEMLFRIAEWKNLNVTSTYTYFRSEFTDKDGIYRPSSWDTRHLLNLITNYKFSKSWNVAARWRYVGGAPYSPIDKEKSTQRAAWDITNQPYLDYSRFNSERLQDAHQLDIRIDKEFYFKKWLLNVYADVQNVYNFQTASRPIYTNKNTDGSVAIDPDDPSRYNLRQLESFGGTLLPTIGLIVKF